MLKQLEKILTKNSDLIIEYKKKNKLKFKQYKKRVKCNIDNVVDKKIKEDITKKFKNIPIISEEDLKAKKINIRPAKYFILDPIDGTGSLVEGYSTYVTQIGYVVNEKVICSVVYAPELKDVYTAEIGKGAYKNKKKIKTKISSSEYSLIDNYPTPKGLAKKIIKKLKIKKYIECGSIGLKLCKVADGTANIFVKNVDVYDWDILPPYLILKEAGGFISDYNGAPVRAFGNIKKKGIIASSSFGLQKKIKQLINVK